MKLNIKKVASPVLITIFPIVFLFANNSKEADIKDAIYLILGFSFATIMATVFLLFILHFSIKATLIAEIFSFFLLNYALLEKIIKKIFPQLYYWHVFPLLLFVLFVLFINIYRHLPESTTESMIIIINIACVSLLTFNIIISLPNIIKGGSDNRNTAEKITIEKPQSNLPDIYYFVLDEYSNFNFIKKYYNYDNSVFESFLREKHFTISSDSYNDSDQTLTVLTNILNLDYISTNATSQKEKYDMRQSAVLYQILKKAGYELIGVGKTDYTFALTSLTQGSKTTGIGNVRGETFSQIVLKNSFLYPLITIDHTKRAQEVLKAFDYFEDETNLKQHLVPTCTITYIESPQPFLFDPDGRNVSPGDYYNWSDKKFYLNQYKYISEKMIRVIDNIISANPNCIIFVSSDHSARFRDEFEAQDKKSPFHALYYCGNLMPSISGKSGVNTWRIILNELLNLKLDENVEVPGNE